MTTSQLARKRDARRATSDASRARSASPQRRWESDLHGWIWLHQRCGGWSLNKQPIPESQRIRRSSVRGFNGHCVRFGVPGRQRVGLKQDLRSVGSRTHWFPQCPRSADRKPPIVARSQCSCLKLDPLRLDSKEKTSAWCDKDFRLQTPGGYPWIRFSPFLVWKSTFSAWDQARPGLTAN